MDRLYQVSIDLIEKNQSAAGGFCACPSFPVYRYSWLRDGTFIAYALDMAGEHGRSRKFHVWVDGIVRGSRGRIERLGHKLAAGGTLVMEDFLPARFLPDGSEQADDWPNYQLDGYGTWLWGLAEHIALTGDAGLLDEMRDGIGLVVEYLRLCWRLPNYDCWEEHGDQVHVSTLACLAGGIGRMARLLGDESAAGLAREIWSYVEAHGVTKGHLAKFAAGCTAGQRIELDDTNANSDIAVGGEVDASHLWAVVPFGLLSPDEPLAVRTVGEIERTLVRECGVHRFSEDTYYGGGCWPLLTAWLGWYYVKAGRLEEARACLGWIERQADGLGFLPEQTDSHLLSPERKRYWVERWGPVAKPLLWSHAMYMVLSGELKRSVEEVHPRCTLDAAGKKP